MVRCPFCCSASTRWDESGDHLDCCDCGQSVTIRREPPQSYDEYIDAPSGGRLARWIENANDELDADRAWLLAEITRLDNYRVRVIGAAGKATRCLVTLTILGWLARQLWNIARTRSGEADLIVRAARKRTATFSGYRHAASTALESAPLLGFGSGIRLGDAQPKFSLRSGVQFKRIACSPARSGATSARGEDALLDRIDLDAAMRAAGLSPTDRRMLELHDVGVVRTRARRSRKGIAPAVEPLSVADILERLRGLPDLPRNEREARKRIQRARGALRGALRERGLIPPPERRPVPKPAAPVPAEPAVPRRASEALRA